MLHDCDQVVGGVYKVNLYIRVPDIFDLSDCPSKGPYFGLGGASITVIRVTLLKSGSVSGARRANMSRMSLCK